jgi:hypothetical protein
MIRALALVCAAWPAMACDLDGSLVTGEHVPGGADLYVQNNTAFSRAPGAVCVLEFDFGDVVVDWRHAPSSEPDAFTVTPPPGWHAFPPDGLIPEGGAVRVLIREGMMG